MMRGSLLLELGVVELDSSLCIGLWDGEALFLSVISSGDTASGMKIWEFAFMDLLVV